MKKLEHSFVFDGDLIIVEARIRGAHAESDARLALDTGAAVTTVTPELAHKLGYSDRDGFRKVTVHTAIGKERGYWLRVAEFSVLGVMIPSFPLQVFDLGHDDLDGLLGMNFLLDFNFEIRPTDQRIILERIAALTPSS